MTQYVITGSTSGTDVETGDSYVVTTGGRFSGYTIEYGGSVSAESGGILSGGVLSPYFTGTAQDLPQETVLSGGQAIGTTVNGGSQIVDGGSATATVLVGAGGFGTDESQLQIVENGGVATGTQVEATPAPAIEGGASYDPELIVRSDGTAVSASISGQLYNYNDGLVFTAIANAVGLGYVESGGVASATTVGFDGELYVSAGGALAGLTVISGGTQTTVYGQQVTSGGVLVLNGTAGSGEIEFLNGLGEIIVNGTDFPTNEITQLGADSLIDLASIPLASVLDVRATADQLIVDTTSGSYALNVDNANAHTYLTSSDGHGGTDVTLCYLHGSRILTPTGERLVEELAIGDPVVTRWNGILPIRWIGRQSYYGPAVRDNSHKRPVRIRRDALGSNRPARDLWVSPGHSMLLSAVSGEERLVLASTLVNGVTVTQDEVPSEMHYVQIELHAHDCVIAEGTWSETYADGDGLRGQFHNVAEFYQLYPEHRETDELVLCAPRPERGPKLDAVLRQVVDRASANLMPGPLRGAIDLIPTSWKVEGWAQDQAHPDLPVVLEVLLDDKPIGTVLACDHRCDLQTAGIGQGRCAFAFSSPVRLPPDRMHGIRVRRLTDGAELAMSDACHHRIEMDHASPSPQVRARVVAA